MKAPKKEPQTKFDFEEMKAAATHDDPAIRKQTFIAYFERFGEFPSYLFDNLHQIDSRLLQTINDLREDAGTSTAMHKGLDALIARLPA